MSTEKIEEGVERKKAIQQRKNHRKWKEMRTSLRQKQQQQNEKVSRK